MSEICQNLYIPKNLWFLDILWGIEIEHWLKIVYRFFYCKYEQIFTYKTFIGKLCISCSKKS